uniref:Uncharacterized protein n=1 Tax=Peronospora matthiolae TaxID=2874970 RepID=A0AAV1TP47_9STRA
MDDAMRRSIFGSSDESDEPSPKRRRSRSRDSGANSGVGSPVDTTSQQGASTSVGTSKKSGTAAWNAYIHNLEDVGRDVWNDKLIKARDKFKKRTPTGTRYKLHRLSKEKGLPCLSWVDSCSCCVNNSARAPKEAYLPNSPWWRVRISSETYEGIDNLKSLYDRAGKTFSGGPSAAQDVPCRTAQPDPVRQPSVGSGAPKHPRTGDSRVTERDNSSDVRSRRGGSTAAQPDSAGHRESSLMEVEEEGRRSPHNRGEACVPESFFDRVTQALRGDLEHERDRRLQLSDTILKHRAEFAFAQLKNERALTSPRDELRVARGSVDRSRAEITALQTLVDAHHREHKALCEMLERKGVLHRKKQRTDGTA